MGCGGGYSSLFRILDDISGCGSRRHDYHNHNSNDSYEKIMIIKKMYAESLINDSEYHNLKERVYSNQIGFDELIEFRSDKLSRRHKTFYEPKKPSDEPNNEYKVKIKKLKESKEKIVHVQGKLINSINSLKEEKVRMESLAESIYKLSEEAAEEYIGKKIDLEENLMNLEKRSNELKREVDEIDSTIKNLETKELELEAVLLQEEISKYKI